MSKYETKHALLAEFQPAHLDEILCDLRDTLLAFVYHEARPIDELLVNLRPAREGQHD